MTQEHETHILKNDQTSFCGTFIGAEFHFLNLEHAKLSAETDRFTICPKCLDKTQRNTTDATH